MDHSSGARQLYIEDHTTDFIAVIDLDRGASLSQWISQGKTIIKNMEHQQARDIYYSSFLFPFVNRVEDGRFRFRESEFILPINEPENNNAIHGCIANQCFDIDHIQCDDLHAAIKLSYTYKGDKSYFPFPFKIDITYTCDHDGLEIRCHVTNTGANTFPYSLGWHPYFNLPSKTGNLLKFNAIKMVEVNERCLPVEVINHKVSKNLEIFIDRVDDCYELKNPVCTLITQDYTLTLTSSKESNYLQVYHPLHTDRVAVEPLTGIANCFNNGVGLRVLDPQAQFSQSWNVVIS
jgi:aldose 1-epimerase